jgi:MFS family permease
VYDFYLYAVLAPFFAALFFPPGNQTAALLSAFAAYAAGFLVRPFGALLFGRIGDLVGRKYTFLVTIVVMGSATFLVGLLPTYESVGWAAPILMVSLRLLQGLALGGEYGGAATYVAEHAPNHRRGYDTSWIQTTATLGLFLALLVIWLCRSNMDAKTFAEWGWRLPFWVSIILLAFSVYIRLKLEESPVFQKMKSEGKGSKSPLTDSFMRYPNNKYVLLALLGATAGQGVVWYTGQFYALFFILIFLKLDYVSAYSLIGLSLLIGTPFFIFFGWLSDRIGRLKIILAGCLIAAVTYFPLFAGLTHYINPGLEEFQAKTPISVTADRNACNFHIFVGPWSKFSDCDRTKDYLTKQGLSFKSIDGAAGSPVITTIGSGDRRRQDRGRGPEGDRRGADQGRLCRSAGPVADQLGNGRGDPGDHGDLRHDGVRPDCGLPGGAVPGADPIHLDVAALSHRQRLVRRHAAADRHGHGRGDRGYLLRTLVSDRGGADDARHRYAVPEGGQGPRHPPQRERARGALTLSGHGKSPPRAGFFLLTSARGRPAFLP